MAGPLGVTHLILFSRSTSGNTNMRIAITPRGPTLHFRVDNYSLCKDIMKTLRHPKSGGQIEFLTAPLLVMNNFTTATADSSKIAIPKHLESLITTVFQSLFPPISPQTTPLTSIRRVLLLNREPSKSEGSYTLSLRHYAIGTKVAGLPKSIRRLNAAEKLLKKSSATAAKDRKRGLPNLGKLEDVADYLLDPSGAGYTSASETEQETDAEEVEVLAHNTRKVLNRKEKQRAQEARAATAETNGTAHTSRHDNVEKRAVKLTELGPRMKLRLTKVEEGVCTGKVLWHEFVHKTDEEIREMDQVWEERRRVRDERRRQQKENVEKKNKDRKTNGKAGKDNDEDDDELWDSEGFYDEDGMDDAGEEAGDDDEEMDGMEEDEVEHEYEQEMEDDEEG
ncbi:hypothetical protein LTS18_013282 [Coniosporium uncinatum]|uniref:Uncharacterized protein n=1 Tax=Coniosporium uncinatum TaxID=93489 RepID=A0ACC3D9B7_9PEZI|nr:hypothetical protein LTS18_013282 [Coniosporium uncinatum]